MQFLTFNKIKAKFKQTPVTITGSWDVYSLQFSCATNVLTHYWPLIRIRNIDSSIVPENDNAERVDEFNKHILGSLIDMFCVLVCGQRAEPLINLSIINLKVFYPKL